MDSTSSEKGFLLRATACIKVTQSLPQQTSSVRLPEAEMPVVKNLGNGLCVVYLVDTDDGLIYVQNRDLSGTNLTPEGLHELGLYNLGQRSAGKLQMHQYGPAYAFVLDGLFEASLILLDELWDETLAHLAPNGFIAAFPSRDTLAVCDAQSVQGIAGLRNMVNKVFPGGDHLLTSDLYRRQNGEWAPLR